VHEELARVEGVPVLLVRLVFMLLIAMLIAIGMQVIGILLTTALLIIPAAGARSFARTPEQMAALASLVGATSVVLGVSASWWWDSPTGPSIVVAAAVLFGLSFAVRRPA
jgi:zinc transport system permease protein